MTTQTQALNVINWNNQFKSRTFAVLHRKKKEKYTAEYLQVSASEITHLAINNCKYNDNDNCVVIVSTPFKI